MNLYLTADQVGIPTGGGIVTKHESGALAELGPCEVWDQNRLVKVDKLAVDAPSPEALKAELQQPWLWDHAASTLLSESGLKPRLTHIYAGCWPHTVKRLKDCGSRVAVTVAAHDRHVSRREHEALSIPFNYPHLVHDGLWRRYIEGYRLADVIVCPSEVAACTVRAYGPDFEKKDIRVIHHGCEIPARVKPLPRQFTVGYLGSFGADKGVRYLLEAWKKLNYRDAILMLGGKDSTSEFGQSLVRAFGGGNIACRGWLANVSDFYNAVSLYVQPSATEGFGIEVVEAMAYGRPVLCSTGAGAVDCVPNGWHVKACNVDGLANMIELARDAIEAADANTNSRLWTSKAGQYTWGRVRGRYQELWKEMISA